MGRGGGPSGGRSGGHSSGGHSSGGSRGFSGGGSRSSSGSSRSSGSFGSSRSSSSFGSSRNSSSFGGNSRGFSSGGSRGASPGSRGFTSGGNRNSSSGRGGGLGSGSNNSGSYGNHSSQRPGSRPDPSRPAPGGGYGGYGGGYRPRISIWPIFIGRRGRYGNYGSFNGYNNYNNYDNRNGYSGGHGGAGGLGKALRTILVVFLVLIIIASCSASLESGPEREEYFAPSTVKREPLENAVTVDVGYFTDTLDWIENPGRVNSAMKSFYKKTGVMPYLVVIDNMDGFKDPTDADAMIYCDEIYQWLFTDEKGHVDEAHMLVVFFEPYDSEYSYYITAGTTAQQVIDTEARAIIGSYFDSYYTDSSLSDSQYFAKVFEKSAERIMSVTRPSWFVPMIIISLCVVLYVCYRVWAGVKEKKIAEAKANADILNTPLETYGSAETTSAAEDLASKYENR